MIKIRIRVRVGNLTLNVGVYYSSNNCRRSKYCTFHLIKKVYRSLKTIISSFISIITTPKYYKQGLRMTEYGQFKHVTFEFVQYKALVLHVRERPNSHFLTATAL